jgi:HD superfamily phosphohydrolase
MSPTAEKLFRDPVHGYIRVERDLCVRFIDTPIFQRLRNVEQTSMRTLFPGAHHDRFVHSLGVYHLARLTLERVQYPQADLSPADWAPLARSFEIAALLHDCGHSPFSHTCEHFYHHSDVDETRKRASIWLDTLVNEQYKVDYKQGGLDPAAHEIFSAALLLDEFNQKIVDSGGDPQLIARMITGCRFSSPRNNSERISNALIELLNGTAIDLDKLDYIIRDTWASGVKNAAVDIERLISAIQIKKGGLSYILCFRKSALSVIQTVVDARNYLFEWIYNHHTVLYYAKLLDSAIRKLAVIYSPTADPDFFWNAVFSKDAFKNPVPLFSGLNIFLPSDGDLLQLLKSNAKTRGFDMVGEILSHAPERVPLWKTYSEYKLLCEKYHIAARRQTKAIRDTIPATLARICGVADRTYEFLVIEAESKDANIEPNDIMIDMGEGEPISFTRLFEEKPKRSHRFFYVFVPRAYLGRMLELQEAVFVLFT